MDTFGDYMQAKNSCYLNILGWLKELGIPCTELQHYVTENGITLVEHNNDLAETMGISESAQSLEKVQAVS